MVRWTSESPPEEPSTRERADGVDLVHEDDGWRVLSSHDEQLSHHAAALADVFLDQLRAGHPDELAVGVMRDRTSQQCLARARGSVEKHALGLGDTQRFEQLGVLEAELDHLLDLLDLLVQAADHVVCAVGHLLDHHEGDEWID